MRKIFLGTAFACGLLFAAAPVLAQGECSRADLQKATDAYIGAQTKGDATLVPLSGWTQYSEQMEMGTMSTGILSTPQKIDFHRSLLDPLSCMSFTEMVITDPKHPYVLGTLLEMRGDRVHAIETLITDHDDWLFNAANTLKYSRAEDWSEIPPEKRESRTKLIAAANAYLDSFDDKSVAVPWGSPCARLEGGLYTGKGAPGTATAEDSCNVGVPSGVKLTERRYIVDPAIGAVTVLLRFGKDQLPDAHTFRIEEGKIRYVHTITVCKTFNCGFKVPKELQTAGK
ncbi:MAG TPA: hypothetical protein VNZ43_16120 [Sphingomonadaceae bacterium]|jgi:hypothetical protein|nr:hypothetical protein [Sphingomonadaceae bacterium]